MSKECTTSGVSPSQTSNVAFGGVKATTFAVESAVGCSWTDRLRNLWLGSLLHRIEAGTVLLFPFFDREHSSAKPCELG